MKEHIEEIVDYMETYFSDNLKVEDIADKFGYSKFHFSREFKRLIGISPNEYLSSLKIDQGIRSILNGESIIDSQLDAGYSSSGTFSSTFTRSTGLSPKKYLKSVDDLYMTVKQQEIVNEDNDSLFYRNPDFAASIAPYKLTVFIEVPESFKGLVFCGLFLKPNPNHLPAMGRCRSRVFEYEYYHLPQGTYYPLACGIKKSLNPFHYFKLKNEKRACDGQSITFPLEKNEEIYIKLRDVVPTDPPILINLPNILANGLKQQIQRSKRKVKRKLK